MRSKTLGEDFELGSGKKMSKPLLERQRRARINTCLTELKHIVLVAMNKNPSLYNKMEKADILEMTLNFLRSSLNSSGRAALANDLCRLRGVCPPQSLPAPSTLPPFAEQYVIVPSASPPSLAFAATSHASVAIHSAPHAAVSHQRKMGASTDSANRIGPPVATLSRKRLARAHKDDHIWRPFKSI